MENVSFSALALIFFASRRTAAWTFGSAFCVFSALCQALCPALCHALCQPVWTLCPALCPAAPMIAHLQNAHLVIAGVVTGPLP